MVRDTSVIPLPPTTGLFNSETSVFAILRNNPAGILNSNTSIRAVVRDTSAGIKNSESSIRVILKDITVLPVTN